MGSPEADRGHCQEQQTVEQEGPADMFSSGEIAVPIQRAHRPTMIWGRERVRRQRLTCVVSRGNEKGVVSWTKGAQAPQKPFDGVMGKAGKTMSCEAPASKERTVTPKRTSRPYRTPLAKISSKCVNDVTLRPTTANTLEKTWRSSFLTWFGNAFFKIGYQTHKQEKQKSTSEITPNKNNQQNKNAVYRMMTTFVNHLSCMWLMSKIYLESHNSIAKKIKK